MHQATKFAVTNFLSKPSHGLLITGLAGVGKGYIARYIAAKLLGIEQEKLDNYPYFYYFGGENEPITIDDVRQIRASLARKVPGQNQHRRIILLDNAKNMTTEAQNGILKALEEPPKDTVVILTADDTSQLLPTIISRAQQIVINPLPEHEIIKLVADETSASTKRQAMIARGRPGLLWAMQNDSDHPFVQAIDWAKNYLTMPASQKLQEANNIKDRDMARLYLEALALTAFAATDAAIGKNDSKKLRSLVKKTLKLERSQRQLDSNSHLKLLFTDIAMQL